MIAAVARALRSRVAQFSDHRSSESTLSQNSRSDERVGPDDIAQPDGGTGLEDTQTESSLNVESAEVSPTGEADESQNLNKGHSSDGEDTADSEATDIDFDDEKLLNGIGLPLFMIDRNGGVIAWNESMEQLTGVTETDVQQANTISDLLYREGDRSTTLAEQVLDSPDEAHVDSDIQLADDSLQIYESECEFTGEDDTIRHYECSARPLFQDGELAAVLQTVQNRTAEVQRHETISALVGELIHTFKAIGAGELNARVEFADTDDVVDDELLVVVDEVNAMADQLESLVNRVNGQTETLATLGEDSANAAVQIDDHVAQQRDLLDSIGHDMEQFSANMEEVAARADQIATSAEDARSAAENGREAGKRARSATETVTATSENLVETVGALDNSIAEIEGVLEVIDDVAEQTNMLALNASIESARAGEAGDSFGVVAEEIKQLASETREHTEAIEESIDMIQDQADTATTAVEESHEEVQEASTEIDEALTAFDEVAEAVDETASGIQQVAESNEVQAQTVQEVSERVEEARDQADNVEATTDRIVELIQEQQSAIEELQTRVQSLSQNE